MSKFWKDIIEFDLRMLTLLILVFYFVIVLGEVF